MSAVARLIRGSVAFVAFVANTVFWGFLLYLLMPLKLFAPTARLRRRSSEIMVRTAENWISVNSQGLELLHRIDWRISGVVDEDRGLDPGRSYLVIANHRSWVDIVVLQKIFNRRIPFLRFFLKRELIYVPILGGAWWALDYPFMKRHSRATLEKHPEKRADDYGAIRRAVARFRGKPVSVLNFLEGTRFTDSKREQQNSPYRHLLAPKAGGVAFVLEAMGERFDSLLDVTIDYAQEPVTLWALLSGRIRTIHVDVRRVEIPRAIIQGRYLDDPEARERMRAWIDTLWAEKDQLLEEWRSLSRHEAK